MSAHLKSAHFLQDVPKAAQQLMLTALSQGNSLRTAAKAARTPYQKLTTYFSWAEKVLNEPTFFPEDYVTAELELLEFFQACQAVEAQKEVELVLHLHTHASKNWQAAAHVLGKRNPEDWGDKKNAPPPPSSGPSPVGNPLISSPQIDLKRLTADELAILERLLEKATVHPEDIIENDSSHPNSFPQARAALPDRQVLSKS